ncbi:ATP-binding protein [Streptomyces sp. CA-294286]|uniref:ATP-binding protein n=1 Tax=Streptomyces sp. CA-294286 TaxID=3240070 RepID=UPI003D90CE2C
MNETTQLTLCGEHFFRRERRSVPEARRFVGLVLAELGDAARSDDVLLCVSELATNALEHGVPPGRGFQIRVWAARDLVRLEVHDSGPGKPRKAEVGGPALKEGGRGLLIVAALADNWGVGERNPGKVVWCEFGAEERRAPVPGTAQGTGAASPAMPRAFGLRGC